MAQPTLCQRPQCDQPGKPRTMTEPAAGKEIKVNLCDEDYHEVSATNRPPHWLNELLTHIGLVG